jgi:hypothetical protein
LDTKILNMDAGTGTMAGNVTMGGTERSRKAAAADVGLGAARAASGTSITGNCGW